MSDHDDFERRLRACLDENAGRAPSGDGLAELVIAEATQGVTPLNSRRSPRSWMLPLLAAAAVAAVVLSIVGITTWHGGIDAAPSPSEPALTHLPSTSGSLRSGTSSTAATPSAPAHPTGLSTAGPTPSTSTRQLPDGETVRGFTAADLTFNGTDNGWALGSAVCSSTGVGRCTAIYRTTDGTDWHSVPGPSFNVAGVKNCAAPCVSHIRFATVSTGYVWGPDVLFMTTDGGTHWAQQKRAGGAEALETLNDNVIRLVSTNGVPCDAGCTLTVETAKVGSSKWTEVALPGGASTRVGAQLTRSGATAYALLLGNPVGGGDRAVSTLFVSTDNGTSWSRSGERCPQLGGREVDSVAVAASPSGVALLCRQRFAPVKTFVAVSTDSGATFAATAGRLPGATLLTGDPSTVLVAAGADAYRSVDGGRSWSPIAELSGLSGPVSFVGFESETTGRAITDNGRRIWTTSTGGSSWAAVTFPG